MWLYKLAEAEDFLELCCHKLISIGAKDSHAFYKALDRICPIIPHGKQVKTEALPYLTTHHASHILPHTTSR